MRSSWPDNHDWVAMSKEPLKSIKQRPGTSDGEYPEGGRFVFTILDDTDDATVDNVEPMYELLDSLGMRTTKTVWANDCPPELKGNFFAAQTLRDPPYLALVRRLVDRGFELAFHNAAMGSSCRAQTEKALAFLHEEFGSIPKIHCNHAQNRDNIYWGTQRYRTGLLRRLATTFNCLRPGVSSEGSVEGSAYFWGDLCREHFRFVRGFSFARIDTRSLPPGGPYHDPMTPWVNYWFTTSDAPDVEHFKRLVARDGVERLARDGGVCILSTHLGKGFVRDGRIDPIVESTLRHIADLPGWFAPVSEVLEHLLERSGGIITPSQRLHLESAHVLDRVTQRFISMLHV